MSIISFIAGLILGLMGLNPERIRMFIRSVLCFITAGFVMKVLFPFLYIWKIEDYDRTHNYYLFFHSHLWWQSMFIVVLVYIFFYKLLCKIGEKILTSMWDKKITNWMNSINSTHLSQNLEFVIKKGVRILFQVGYIKHKKKIGGDKIRTYLEMKDLACSTLVMSLHAILCSLMLNMVFGFNAYFLWVLLITIAVTIIMSVLSLFIMPFLKYTYHIISTTAKTEVNQVIDELSN